MEIDDRGWGRGGGRGGGGGGGGGGGTRRCDHFFRTGNCKFGDSCRFEHVRPNQGRGGGGGGGGGRGKAGGGGGGGGGQQSSNPFGGGAFSRLSGGIVGGGSSGASGGGGGAREVCRNYARGSCRFGDSCRHIHEGAPTSDSSSPFGATSSPFGQPAASSPFGGAATSSPFGGASSSPFGAAAPSSPFGGAAPFGAAPSSPFGGAAPQPQSHPPSDEVALRFVKFFYETFCSSRRSDLQALLKDESCLTLNDQKCGGRERIMQQLMGLPTDLGNIQIRNVESHPTGPDMSSVLVLVIGSMQMQNVQLQISHVFVLMKAQEGQYWVSNMIQRWSQ